MTEEEDDLWCLLTNKQTNHQELSGLQNKMADIQAQLQQLNKEGAQLIFVSVFYIWILFWFWFLYKLTILIRRFLCVVMVINIFFYFKKCTLFIEESKNQL